MSESEPVSEPPDPMDTTKNGSSAHSIPSSLSITQLTSSWSINDAQSVNSSATTTVAPSSDKKKCGTSHKTSLLYRLFHQDEQRSPSKKTATPPGSPLQGESSEEEHPESLSPPRLKQHRSSRFSQFTNSIKLRSNHGSSSSKSSSSGSTDGTSDKGHNVGNIFSHLKSVRHDGVKFLMRSDSEVTLRAKYGHLEPGTIGKGANGVVRLVHRTEADQNGKFCDKLYAVKEFRKRHHYESEKVYIKRVTSEFCISSSLHHENVIETVDLIQNDKHQWCEVMEFCPGGDLCDLIRKSRLSIEESNCFFAQLIRGVAYLHSMGVAHRDLKPENLMLDAHGLLKIADFGEAEVFRSPYEVVAHNSKACVGSEPYMSPEEFDPNPEFDPRLVDLWSCGIIYLAMVHNRIPWRTPVMSDPHFRCFMKTHKLEGKDGFDMLERLPEGPRHLFKTILDPNPDTRATMSQVSANLWFQTISAEAEKCCERGRMEEDYFPTINSDSVSSIKSSSSASSCSTFMMNVCGLTPAVCHHNRHHPPGNPVIPLH